MNRFIDNIKNEISNEWAQKRLQIIGAACLLVAWLVEILWQEAGICLGLLIACGIIDLFLKDTVTRWVRRQFGQWPDLIFVIAGLVLTSWCVYHWPEIRWYDTSLLCAIFAIHGHLFLVDN